MRECGLILLTLTNIKRERGREGRKEGKKDEEGEMAYIIEVLFIPLGNKSKL